MTAPRSLIIDYLSEHLDVPAYGKVPNPRPDGFVRVLLHGGQGMLNPAVEERSITVESWDDCDAAAAERAEKIRRLLKAAPGVHGAPFYRYREFGAPVAYDDDSEQFKYVFSFTMRFRLSA